MNLVEPRIALMTRDDRARFAGVLALLLLACGLSLAIAAVMLQLSRRAELTTSVGAVVVGARL